jgi:uncharacterized protein (TIGR02996 family)
MNSDVKTLLAAIVADPGDDTVRLAYADCIEEQGNGPRAQFIRLQIEAEHQHPDSARRATLDAQTAALFAGYWVGWWTEVCEAVGLPLPTLDARSLFGRLVRRVGWRGQPGEPYWRGSVGVGTPNWRGDGPFYGLTSCNFHRGFPEKLHCWELDSRAGRSATVLARWSRVSPLAQLRLEYGWIDGVHLESVRCLVLEQGSANALPAALASSHVNQLEELRVPASYDDPQSAPWEVMVQALTSDSPQVRRLKRLTIALPQQIVEFMERLSGLESLEVVLPLNPLESSPDGWIDTLARSPQLAGLREFAVTVPRGLTGYQTTYDLHGLQAISHGATWSGLRKLVINADLEPADLHAILEDANLPALEELRLGGVLLSQDVIELLIRSPLLKQLRHLAFRAFNVDGISEVALRRLPEMFDLNRIETFAFHQDRSMPGLYELIMKLGDRLRLPMG